MEAACGCARARRRRLRGERRDRNARTSKIWMTALAISGPMPSPGNMVALNLPFAPGTAPAGLPAVATVDDGDAVDAKRRPAWAGFVDGGERAGRG